MSADSAAEIPEVRVRLPDDATSHWLFLVLSLGVLLAALLLQVRGTEQVVLPLLEVPLPGTCTMRQLTGVGCPGCGLTRCFVSLAHGDFQTAWNFHPVGVFMFGIVLFQLPFRGWQIWRIRSGLPAWKLRYLTPTLLALMIAAILTQWVVSLW